jgi:hypothetical protein
MLQYFTFLKSLTSGENDLIIGIIYWIIDRKQSFKAFSIAKDCLGGAFK